MSVSRLGRSRGRCSTTKTGAHTWAGSAGSTADSASMPPAEVPITTASTRSVIDRCCGIAVPFLKDAILTGHVVERAGVGRPLERFLRADAEEAAPAQRLVEEADGTILQLALEVDQDVAARHHLDLGEDAVGGQAVVREHDVLLQALVEHGPAVARRVVVGQRAAAA